jgi:hypothetical protein
MTNDRASRVAKMRGTNNLTKRVKSSLRNNKTVRANSPRTPLGWQYGKRQLVSQLRFGNSERHVRGELPDRNDLLRQSRYSIETSSPLYEGSALMSPNDARLYANIVAKQLNTPETHAAIQALNVSQNLKNRLWDKYKLNGYTNNNNINY